MAWWGIALIAAGALLLVWLAFGYAAFRVFCVTNRKTDPASRESLEKHNKPYMEHILAGQRWAEAHDPERVETQSDVGLRLVGHLMHHPQQRGVAILVHGYHGAWNLDLACAFSSYYERGFTLLAIEQRAHGESGGRYMTYGVRERFDVRSWVNYVNRRFGAETPILLAGLSLGSSTVQMACGLELPENVRLVVADCGFTSPDEIGRFVLRRNGLPVWLLLPQVRLFCRLLAGFGMREYSTIDAQRGNRIPTVFLHGEDDQLVPCEMSRRNYAACAAPKRLFTVPGARHGVSFLTDREGCLRVVTEMIDRYFP